jgi:hypothetical protein
MARYRGEDFRVFVDNGSGSYNLVAGQTGLSTNNSTPMIDQSAKGDVYSVKSPGRPDMSITVAGISDLPDTNGLERVFSLATARTANNYQVRKSPFAGGDVIFQASCYTGSFSTSKDDQASYTYTFELTLASQPSVSQLI